MAESKNDYDWLGRGIYFWEQGPARAFQFAVDEAKRDSKKIKNPCALGAYIYLGNCFDLLDIKYTELLTAVYPMFKRELKKSGVEIPVNQKKRADGTKLFHRRDCAMIEFTIALLEQEFGEKFHTGRGVFCEVDPGSWTAGKIKSKGVQRCRKREERSVRSLRRKWVWRRYEASSRCM